MNLIGSYAWMLTVRLFGDLFVGSLLIRGCERFDRYLGKRYRAASRFCTFLFNTKYRAGEKDNQNGLLSSHPLLTIYHLPKYIFSLSFLYIVRHVGYENQDINHCVTRLFVRFRCLTGNLSRLQFAITACSPRTLIPILRRASYRVPRSTLAL